MAEKRRTKEIVLKDYTKQIVEHWVLDDGTKYRFTFFPGYGTGNVWWRKGKDAPERRWGKLLLRDEGYAVQTEHGVFDPRTL